MHRNFIRFLTLMISAVLACAASHAAVISMDLNQPGDGLLTYDSVNHRQWLDLSQYFGQPIANVNESLMPGGSLYGFHRATSADVSTLIASSGYVGLDAYSPQDFAIATNLMDLLGQVLNYTMIGTVNDTTPYDKVMPTPYPSELDARFTNGLALHDANSNTLEPFTILTLKSGSIVGGVFTPTSESSGIGSNLFPSDSLTQTTVGASWLYRDVTAPEPTSLAMLTFATLVFSFRARKRASAILK